MKNAFKVTYSCNNCNFVFEESYEKLVEVVAGNTTVTIRKYTRKNSFSPLCQTNMFEVECPNCGLNSVSIRSRCAFV